jgi:hypothetical protein
MNVQKGVSDRESMVLYVCVVCEVTHVTAERRHIDPA